MYGWCHICTRVCHKLHFPWTHLAYKHGHCRLHFLEPHAVPLQADHTHLNSAHNQSLHIRTLHTDTVWCCQVVFPEFVYLILWPVSLFYPAYSVLIAQPCACYLTLYCVCQRLFLLVLLNHSHVLVILICEPNTLIWYLMASGSYLQSELSEHDI